MQFQNCLYNVSLLDILAAADAFNQSFHLSKQIVKDPLFELGITLCIVLNTLFLALEHHGMNQNARDVLEYGNRVSHRRYLFHSFRTYSNLLFRRFLQRFFHSSAY